MANGNKDTAEQLRTGLTTGVCATAAAVAAGRIALGGNRLDMVPITLPRGTCVEVAINDQSARPRGAEAGVIKNAGDDPDATHGARVWVQVEPNRNTGINFCAGSGVGTVTKPGLQLAVGEPAINPVPRQMIREHLEDMAGQLGFNGGFKVIVGVNNGERIAQRTMNARLGIIGGLSILGTTGIVRPFSCSAYVASIHQALDVARVNGCQRVACCTGGTSENVARAFYQLDDMGVIEMGDMFGAVLKYLRRHPLPAIALVAGFGKLSKFAQGHLDTHSRKCSIDLAFLSEQARIVGADACLAARIQAANTSIEALQACVEKTVPLADRICTLASERARRYLPASTLLTVHTVDRDGSIAGSA